MSDQLEAQLAAQSQQLVDARHEALRWREEHAKLSSRLTSMRQTAARTEAFRRVLFEMQCYGLVFHAIDKDTQGASPIPVVVPVGAFAEDDPKTWPVVVEHTIRAAVQAQRSVHFEPLDPDERTRLATREAERTLTLEVLEVEDPDVILHQAVKAERKASAAALKKVEGVRDVALEDNKAMTRELKRLKALAVGKEAKASRKDVVAELAAKHGGRK